MLFEQPTVAAVDGDTGRLLGIGEKALAVGLATAGRVRLVRPVRHGQLVDIALAEEVLGEVVRSSGVSRLSHPRVLACVHVGATHVQRRALDRALRRVGAREVRFVEQPVACAVGMGLAIEEPAGVMVVDVGAGMTDVAVLALGGMVTATSLAVGGDDADDAVRLSIARRFGLVVDSATATEVRRRIGSVVAALDRPRLEVRGRDAATGEPTVAVLSAAEVAPVLEDLVRPILAAAVQCIATAPPDLANDLLRSGVHLCGEGSLLDGLDARLADATGLVVRAAAEPGHSAVLGAARCLMHLDSMRSSVTSTSRR
jgi:rod shape-determining protein MreB